MKTYDYIKNLLTDFPELRDSDRKLIWRVWGKDKYITYQEFIDAPSPETVRRCRQMVQANNPELRSSKYIQEQKDKVERQRGTFVFRQQLSF